MECDGRDRFAVVVSLITGTGRSCSAIRDNSLPSRIGVGRRQCDRAAVLGSHATSYAYPFLTLARGKNAKGDIFYRRRIDRSPYESSRTLWLQ
jgi:hypothetical protein